MILLKWILPLNQLVGIFIGLKTSVQMGGITPSVIENFEKNEHVLAIKYFHEIGKK